ncbi:hypothetical protein BJ742DRAFT_840254 [Cladochytrium replicatum]|nr:hypothetical protein BJ742DRAFT_840254 [Cladochytrium replicatum]
MSDPQALSWCFSVCWNGILHAVAFCSRPATTMDNPNAVALLQEERQAIRDLLSAIDTSSITDPFNSDITKQALSTLAYSDQVDLQRIAAGAYSELTENRDRELLNVDRSTLAALLYLLSADDLNVLIHALAALGNLAVNAVNSYNVVILGGLHPLLRLALSDNPEISANAVGVITNLSTEHQLKSHVAESGAPSILVRLAMSTDLRVQRNATGGLLNLTHSQENRTIVVQNGAVPVLAHLLNSKDTDVLFYSLTAISNLAVDPPNRSAMLLISHLVTSLVRLLDHDRPHIRHQSILALRNLTSEPSFQALVVHSNALPKLRAILTSPLSPPDLQVATIACLRNISILQENEDAIIKCDFLPLLEHVLRDGEEEARGHAVSVVRNLATSEGHRGAICEAGITERLVEVVSRDPDEVRTMEDEQMIVEATACLAFLSISQDIPNPEVLLRWANSSSTPEIRAQAGAVLGNFGSRHTLASVGFFLQRWTVVESYLSAFFQSGDPALVETAVWTVKQLATSGSAKLLELVKQLHLYGQEQIKNDESDARHG